MGKSKIKKINIIVIILVLLCMTMFLALPQIAIDSFFEGIRLWATKVLPALLPFFFLVKLLSTTTLSGTVGKYLTPVTQRLYGVGGVSGYIFVMSILSGYPVGAKLTADIYKDGGLSKGQAHTISAFASTSGPLFVLGTVGIGLFGNNKLGLTILLSHYIGAILNGLLYRNKTKNTQSVDILTSSSTIADNMSSSISSILLVGGFVAIFYMVLSLLLHLNIFILPTKLLSLLGIEQNISTSFLAGLIEVTTGASLLSRCSITFETQAILLAFLISFGGLSIHMQAYCFLAEFDMPYPKFLLMKTTHALLSAISAFILILIF